MFRLHLKFFTLFSCLLFSSVLFPAPVSAQKYDEKTLQCSATLFGTLSKDDCEKICNPPGRAKQTEYACFEIPSAEGCYSCARDQYCADLGFMTIWDCGPCDANPLTECVPAGVTLPFGGGTIGGKTWSGVQCYKCQAKPDRCNQRWPGSSWLAACQANCAAPDVCMFQGIHQGNACFKCQKAPKTCKDMGLLTKAQCGPCDRNPDTQCIWAGFDETGQACFQCVNKNVPPPPPPPPQTCREAGMFDNCNPCIREGKNCNMVPIAPGVLCAQCTEPPAEKRCKPPDLNAWECADCVKRGGQCIARTQVRGEPPCYTCYMPPKPKTGCAKHSLFESCTPNPCSGSEECVIIQPEPNLSCAACEYKEIPYDPTCEERQMWPDCAACYRAQMACRQTFLPDKNMWCARCYSPYEECRDGEWPGPCTQSSCPSGQQCFDTNNNCHRCEGKGTCTERGYLNCQTDCAACEQDPAMFCRNAWFTKDDGNCCECAPRPIGMECDQGTAPGLCPGSCTSQQECKDVGKHCHACLDKKDKCENYGGVSSCHPNPCDPETQVCDVMRPDPKPGLYCYACKTKAEWCSKYGDYFPSCDPDPCQPGERCQMTGVTMSSIECAKCISKEEDEKMCEEFGYADGACTSSTCSSGFDCRDINIYGNKCHKCECGDGTYSGGCAGDSCGEGEQCVETVPGKCHRCDSAGTCRENNLYACETECGDCEKYGDKKCVPAGMTKSDGACCRCVPRYEEDCNQQEALPGLCPAGCRSNEECHNVGDQCHVCLNKKETCEQYEALSSCHPNNPCNPETEVCDALRPGPKLGLYCYGCLSRADWCSKYGDYFPSCDPNPCQPGERCQMTGVTMSSIECAKCVSKEDEQQMCEKYELMDGICTSSSCSAGLECRDVAILGVKCHECECEHGTYSGGCAADSCYEGETCIETVPGKCHRCDSAGTCNDNNLLNCETDCAHCERYGDNKCVPAGMNKSDGACCRCVDRLIAECPKGAEPGVCPRGCHNDEICVDVADKCHQCIKKSAECPQGTTKGACTPSACSSDQKCVMAGDSCYTCQPKDCADLGHLTSCIICDVDNHDCEEIHPRPDLTCYECINNPCSPNLNKDQCAECERQGGICQSLSGGGTRERGKPECFRCVPKPPECPQGTAQGPCTSSSCSSQEECVAAGENCHRCQKKKQSCEDMGMSDGETCTKTCQGGTCTQKTQDDYGTWCWECSKRPVIQPQCDQGYQSGTCPGNCSSDQNCVQGDNNCYSCQEKPRTACPLGMSQGTCPGHCDTSTMDCISDPQNPHCYMCDPRPTFTQCPQGQMPGTCPGSCSSQQECVQSGNCYSCRAKKKTCEDLGMSDGEACMNSCVPKGGQCTQKTQDDYGTWCWECSLSAVQACPQGQQPGNCLLNSMACPMGSLCHQEDNNCYTCIPMDTGPCAGKGMPGPCPGYCSEGEECVPVDNECHYCREKPRTTPLCNTGLNPGGCPGTCQPHQECVSPMWNPECHYCQTKPVTEGDGGTTGSLTGGGTTGYIPGGSLGWTPKGYGGYLDGGGFGYIPGGETSQGKTCAEQDLLPNCVPCQWQGLECIPASNGCFRCGQHQCGENYRPESWCDDCEDDGGYCVPAPGEAQRPGGPRCFDCVDWEECTDYGLVCSCSNCIFGGCVPVMTIEGQYGLQQCYACVKTIPTTYGILIIEPPYLRHVLKSAPDMGGFNPSSVMALVKVDQEKLSQIQKLTQLAKGGIKGFSVGSIQEVAGMLQGMGKKKNFGSDCFSDFAEAPKDSDPPPESAGGKKDASGPSSFGKEEQQEELPNAPIVACGKENGKDVLNIFDASGAKVASLLKDQLVGSNAVLGSLSQAQQMSDKLTQMANADPKTLAMQFGSKLVEKIFSPRKADPKKEGKPTPLEPNDPLYYTDDGKPKSKVKERMKEVAGSVFDSAFGLSVKDKKGPDIEDQWGIRRVGYLPKSDPESAWNVVDGQEKNVVVAVIDSGMDMTHPDSPQHIWMNSKEIPDNKIDDDRNGFIDDVHGWNFLQENNDLTDYKGHGTFVAGIIAAKRNNGIGIAGINPGAVIMPLKVANGEGEANSLNIYRAIMYAVDHGAQVINVSLGAQGVSELEKKAIQYAKDRGVFVSVAGGNVGENIGDHGPASAPGAFVVGALDYNDKISPISNWGANNGLIAPAEKIWSLRSKETYIKGKVLSQYEYYYPQDGTSFSAPMVAATASLLLVKNPGLTPKQIEDILHASADDISREGWDGESGAGVLNAAKALRTDPKGLMTAKITRLRVNKDKNNKIESVDVFGTVRGAFAEYNVQLAKGKDGSGFKPMTGTFRQEATNDWLARIDYDDLKGSSDWTVRIAVKDKQGQMRNADSVLIIEKRSGSQKHEDLYYGR